jgi:hypothetical protein
MGKGQLLFKGDKSKKKKKKSKHSKKDEESSSTTIVKEPSSLTSSASASMPVRNPNKKAEPATPIMKKGTGKISSSGTVVTGHGTKFTKEVNSGDALMCMVNGREELRVITMRLSNQSLNLSSAFSESLKHPVSFQYIRKPRDIVKEQQDSLKQEKESKQDLQQHAFDLYDAGSLVYREKTETGSYRIKRQEVSGTNSREDLLYMRAKKTSDKVSTISCIDHQHHLVFTL